MYVKSRRNPEYQYWPHQSWPMREKKIRIGRLCPVLAELYYLYHKASFHLMYVNTLSRIGRVVLSVSQRQFSSYLCEYFVPYWPSCTICITKAVSILFMWILCPVLAELYYLYHKGSFHLIYVTTLSRIGRVVLSVSQRQFPSYLCDYFVPYWPSCTICITKAVSVLFMWILCPVLAELYYLYHKGSFHLIYVTKM
jgi:uncharacterized pyridoxamine 5'-phosphate oxidase family protein